VVVSSYPFNLALMEGVSNIVINILIIEASKTCPKIIVVTKPSQNDAQIRQKSDGKNFGSLCECMV